MLLIKFTAFLGFLVVNSGFIFLPVQAQNTERICKKSSTEEIESLFKQWNQSLQTGSAEKVAKNYANNAILLPTLSNQVHNNPGEIKDYFLNFLKLKPFGKIDEQNIRIYCNIAINSGIYTFDLNQNGKVNKVQARYTFVYRNINHKWLIIEHHSSAMPEKTK
jgi:uncharacterized protein (TIGR02246 family)